MTHGNSKLDNAVQTAIIAALRLGYYQDQAAELAGITPRSLQGWKKRGREALEHTESSGSPVKSGDEKYVEFFLAVREARIQAEGIYLGVIRTVATDERAPAAARLRASEWWLERSFPDRWGRTDRIEVGGPVDGEPIRIKMLWPEQATG